MKRCPRPEERLTRYGYCLYYRLASHDTGSISIAGPQSSLVFYGAYNKSDATTGALQFVDGMTLFYWYYSLPYLKFLFHKTSEFLYL